MTASTFEPPPDEQRQLQVLAQHLEQGARVVVNLPGQPPLAVSPVLIELLKASLKEFGAGHGVTLLTSKRELSTAEAAELLSISRPHLVQTLLADGTLPHRLVGTHRRLALTDVLRYQAERERQHALLDEITAEEQAAGLY